MKKFEKARNRTARGTKRATKKESTYSVARANVGASSLDYNQPMQIRSRLKKGGRDSPDMGPWSNHDS